MFRGKKKITLVLSSPSLFVRISRCILKTVASGNSALTEEGLGTIPNIGNNPSRPWTSSAMGRDGKRGLRFSRLQNGLPSSASLLS